LTFQLERRATQQGLGQGVQSEAQGGNPDEEAEEYQAGQSKGMVW